MKLYWSNNSIPELADMDSADRKKAWKACYYKPYRHWRTWLFEFFLIVSVLVSVHLSFYLERRYGLNVWPSFSIPPVISMIYGWFLINNHIETMRPYMKKYLDGENRSCKTGLRKSDN
jgi:hypothetical protein